MAAAAVIAAVSGCRRTPGGVIPDDEMAELLADLHTGDAVVESNYTYYVSDSSRQALKQAILKRHGYTQDDLDSSMMWYGAHLDRYRDVYADVEEILQKRLDNSAAVAAANASMSVSGDSVDIWTNSRRYALSRRSATNLLTFAVSADANSRKGDSYTWRTKMHNNSRGGNWTITADYADGTLETLNSPLVNEGWQTLTFHTDSTRVLKRIYGYMQITLPDGSQAIYLDSMQLVRNRLNPNLYMQRYRQRSYRW